MVPGALKPALVAFLCCASAGAADLKGSLGWQGFLDESTDNHLLVGGSVRFPLYKGLGVEPEILYLRGSGSHYDVVLLPNVVWEWGRGRVRPYMIGGIGLLFSQWSGFGGKAEFISAGFGVKSYLNDSWFIAPEARLGWEPHLRFSVGVGYTWKR